MNLDERIDAFEKLGNYLHAIDEVAFTALLDKVRNENPWFTEESVRMALNGVSHYLRREALDQWISAYRLDENTPKSIALVMAGNIPLTGFHDFLSVLVSGHAAMVKLSSKDTILMSFIAARLLDIEPRFEPFISFAERLKHFDAVIATGSDNSARYFHHYFAKYPHIIRKNRISCAVLTGSEPAGALEALGADVFSYFGLGCRNVSKIFIPADYDPVQLIAPWTPFASVIDHHKYHNNYDYQKSILLVNKISFYDTGFVILHENEKLVSPISVVYMERYKSPDDLMEKIDSRRDKIQCIVGDGHDYIPFGKAQSPEPWDYADRVDTLEFLSGISRQR